MAGNKKFTPLISGIGALRLKLLRECDRLFREKNFPLDMDQVSVLRLLYGSPGLTQKEIGTQLQRDKGSVNRTISVFSEKGIVKVIMDKQDKRKTRIELTIEGKNLAKQTEIVLVKYEKSLASLFSEEEYQTFNLLMNKLLN
ncbi:DNA-binding transcriptional regulator, MarR family [Chitinophaga sp. CF118]|uniref:MarR family winged helix-turn-helix transcriptional regulator n=1 Tax=Chitinophaga sp. CF118 TaxID=1884367 RepID=UPI0008F0280A|nr:MarR family transcriptional regulator [Chitinophaga sp. CF118]SFD22383.1 DNA-binding transcriptional regulator, MarR family [Chitinophaga sp. CF118]